jgi:hypothetical protein
MGVCVAGLTYTHLTHKVLTLLTVDVPDVLLSRNLIPMLDKGFQYFKIWLPHQRGQIIREVKCESWERKGGPEKGGCRGMLTRVKLEKPVNIVSLEGIFLIPSEYG